MNVIHSVGQSAIRALAHGMPRTAERYGIVCPNTLPCQSGQAARVSHGHPEAMRHSGETTLLTI